jgi:predicted small secreted protein
MRQLAPLFLVIAAFTLTGCEAIATIFEAGVWVGVIIVVVILALVGFIFSRFRR